MAWLLLYYTLEILKWLVVARAVLSWFVPPTSTNALVELLRRITDPLLRPVSELLPNPGGIDISPIVVFVLIVILQSFIARAVFF